MKSKFHKKMLKFSADQSGATPLEIGAGVMAAIAVAIGFVVVLETMI